MPYMHCPPVAGSDAYAMLLTENPQVGSAGWHVQPSGSTGGAESFHFVATPSGPRLVSDGPRAIGTRAAWLVGACALAVGVAQHGKHRRVWRRAALGLAQWNLSPVPQEKKVQPCLFDPLGFNAGLPASLPGNRAGHPRLRAAKVRHGRVAVLGLVGPMIAHCLRLPGFEDATALSAMRSNRNADAVACAVTFSCAGILEACLQAPLEEHTGDSNSAGLGQSTKEMQKQGITTGCMATLAVMGHIAMQAVTDKDLARQLGL